MKNWKINLAEFGPIKEDGGRNTLTVETLASCKKRGTAELIAKYLRTGAYKNVLETVSENFAYKITVEQ